MATRNSRLTPGFRWNEEAKRYIGPGSRGFVKNTEVRAAIDDYIAAAEQRIIELSAQLQAGEIDVATWQLGMRRALTDIHLANAAAAKGGWAQLTPADYGRVGQMVKQELGGKKAWENAEGKRGGLNQFAQDIEDGLPLDGRFLQRARQYAQAGRHTYEEIRRKDMMDAGMTEARSIRHTRDSCYGCVTQAALGWQPITDVVPIGTRDCLRNCKCTVEYRKESPF